MGIKSSSTTPLILADAKVPVTNLIGNVGDGAKIAAVILATFFAVGVGLASALAILKISLGA